MWIQDKHINIGQKIFLVLFVIITTFSFLYSPGTGDINYWEQWDKNADTYGLSAGFKANDADYPPFATVILFTSLKISRLFKIGTFDSIKLSILVFLFLTSFLFWLWTRDIMLTVALHLSLILNSIAMAYIDVFFATTLLLSLWALKERRLTLFTVFYTIACLTKWQPLIIAPFLALHIMNIEHVAQWKQIEFKKILQKVLLPLIVILILTFSVFGVAEVTQALLRTSATRPFLSGYALNFNWIVSHFLQVFYPNQFGHLNNGEADFVITTSPKLLILPQLLFICFYLITVITLFKREKTFENTVLFSLLGYLAYFIFNIGVHENHLFLASVLSVVLFWLNKKHALSMLILILVSNMNLFLFNGIYGTGLEFDRAIGHVVDVALLFSIVNVVFFLFLWLTNILPCKSIETIQ